MSDHTSRIKPVSMNEMHPEWTATLERIPGEGLKGANFPSNVLGTLMQNPETFGPFLNYWVTSKLAMNLSVREQELVILRMGVHYQCDYVWRHHVPVAREFGVTDAELTHLKGTELPRAFSIREQAFLELTDELVNHRTIRPGAWEKWAPALTSAQIVDLISLVSQYVFFALINNAVQVELEEPLYKIPSLSERLI